MKGAQHPLVTGPGRPQAAGWPWRDYHERREHITLWWQDQGALRRGTFRRRTIISLQSEGVTRGRDPTLLTYSSLVTLCSTAPVNLAGQEGAGLLQIGGQEWRLCLLVAWGIPGACMYRTTTDPAWADPNGGRLAGEPIEAAVWASHPIFLPGAGFPVHSPPLTPGARDMPPPQAGTCIRLPVYQQVADESRVTIYFGAPHAQYQVAVHAQVPETGQAGTLRGRRGPLVIGSGTKSKPTVTMDQIAVHAQVPEKGIQTGDDKGFL